MTNAAHDGRLTRAFIGNEQGIWIGGGLAGIGWVAKNGCLLPLPAIETNSNTTHPITLHYRCRLLSGLRSPMGTQNESSRDEIKSYITGVVGLVWAARGMVYGVKLWKGRV